MARSVRYAPLRGGLCRHIRPGRHHPVVAPDAELESADATPRIYSIDQHERWIFAFIDSMAAIIIPRRVFRSQEHEQEFVAALHNDIRS